MTEAPPRAIEDFPAYSYRDDPAVPVYPDAKALIVFDGVCVMCNALARFVAARDSKDEFLFTQAQSALGQALFRHYGLNHTEFETNLLIVNGRANGRLEAFARILRKLGRPWSLARAVILLPRASRNRFYSFVAQNRYSMFGKYEACPAAGDPAIKARLID